jgi:hypothetical protein
MNRKTLLATAAWSATLGLIALGVSIGCSDGGSTRTSVSGKVTFDGKPVKSGQIAFEPVGAGRLGIAQVVDGAYSMPAEQGPTAGSYVVRITANRPTGQKAKSDPRDANQAPADVFEQFIPAQYNDRSELKTEIGAESEVVRDFDLTSA